MSTKTAIDKRKPETQSCVWGIQMFSGVLKLKLKIVQTQGGGGEVGRKKRNVLCSMSFQPCRVNCKELTRPDPRDCADLIFRGFQDVGGC